MILFLILGAIINVAVAWGCCWFIIPEMKKSAPVPFGEFWPMSLVPRITREYSSAATYWAGFGVDEADFFYFEFDSASIVESIGAFSVFADSTPPRSLSEELGDQIDDIYWQYNQPPASVTAIDIRQELHELQNRKQLDLYCRAGWPLQSLEGWSSSRLSDIRPTSTVQVQSFPDGSSFAILRTIQGKQLIRVLPYAPVWPELIFNSAVYAASLFLLFSVLRLAREQFRAMRHLCPKCAYPVGASDTCTECGRPVKRKIIAQKAGAE